MSSTIRDVVYEYGNLRAAAYYSIHGQAPWRTNCDDAFLLGCRKLGDFLMRDERSKNRGQELDAREQNARGEQNPSQSGAGRRRDAAAASAAGECVRMCSSYASAVADLA